MLITWIESLMSWTGNRNVPDRIVVPGIGPDAEDPRIACLAARGRGNFAFGHVAENVPEAQALVSVRESRRVEYIALAPAVYRSYIRRMCNDYE